ncbi:MAG: hypothetical protein VXY93_10155, partial [Pseudomonadota bacterium]|nr:hypothetical protein [Pseudomonadota bacterium]
SGSTVGTAGTINFGDNLSVSPASAGIVTITGSAGVSTSQFDVNKLDVSGISTFKGAVDINADVDIDGHTNLDNVSIAGVVTATTFVGALTGNVTGNVSGNATGLTGNPTISVTDLDVDGHTNLDNVSVAGVTTFTGAISASDIRSNALTLKNAAGSASYAVFSNGGSALLKHNNTDRLETSASGVTVTGTVAATSYTGDGSQLTGITAGITTISGTVSVANDLDVDGHTNLDNVSIAGVVTATTLKGALQATSGTFSSSVAVTDSTESNSPTTGSVKLSGGLGVVKNIYTSGGAYVQGTAGLNVTHSADINGDLDVDGHTNLDNVSIAGVVTATTFVGDGSGLTGITASGSGVVIKHDGSTVGTAGTINFGTNLDVSAISGGAVTITASGGSGSGISTISGVVNIANDLDVDGHTNLDNVSIAGVSTFTGDLTVDTNTFHVDSSNNRIGVGIITPARKLQIHQSDSTANYLHVTNSTTGSAVSDGALFGINSLEQAVVWNQENDDIIFGTNNTQRLTLNNSGHLVPAADATYNLG